MIQYWCSNRRFAEIIDQTQTENMLSKANFVFIKLSQRDRSTKEFGVTGELIDCNFTIEGVSRRRDSSCIIYPYVSLNINQVTC